MTNGMSLGQAGDIFDGSELCICGLISRYPDSTESMQEMSNYTATNNSPSAAIRATRAGRLLSVIDVHLKREKPNRSIEADRPWFWLYFKRFWSIETGTQPLSAEYKAD
jgi:hypothetical protein